jgi:site-specific recombinase XerD
MRKKESKYPQIMREIRTYLLELPKPRTINTIKSYSNTIEQLLDYIGKSPDKISYKDIYRWKEWILNKTTQRGKTHYRNSFANIFCAVNVFCKVYKIKNREGQYLHLIAPERINPEHDRVSLDIDEVNRLYEESKGDIRNYTMFKLIIETGCRVSELIHLNVDDVKTREINGNTVYYVDIGNRDFTPKANSFHQAIISKDTYDALQELIQVRTPIDDVYNYKVRLEEQQKRLKKAIAENNYQRKRASQSMISYLNKNHNKSVESQKAVFHNIYNRRIGYTDIQKTMKRYAVKCGITKRVTPHTFRHTCINLMKVAGKSHEEIKSQTGHKSSKTLDIYGNLRFEQQSQVFNDVFVKRDTPTVQPVPKQSVPLPTQTNKATDKKDIEILLIERLAKGEISSESFGLAMLKLKKNEIPNMDYHQ